MAADIAYAQLVHALAELVRALADEAPLILFIDDGQRLHQTSWRVLFDLLDRVRDARFLLVVATRRLPAWFGSVCRDTSGHVTRNIRLAPFSPDESHTFMRHWSDKNRVSMPDDDAATCTEASAGNPFYLGELAAHVVRGGDLRSAPKSIRELIELQYAAVSKGAQRLLLVIALFEGRATLGRVTQVMELGADEFMASLDEIEEAGLTAAKGPALRCKHELVAETAIGLAMEGVQTFARVRIAELLEQEADATNSVELLGDCVTHWERAGELRRAYLAAMKLGSRLVGLGMGTEAERAYERAREFAQLPEELISALEGHVAASRLCANWASVIDHVTARARIQSGRQLLTCNDAEYDLAFAEATMFTFACSAAADRILAIAADDRTSALVRFRAATLVAMHGDNNYSTPWIAKASDALHTANQTTSSDTDELLFALVFHTTIGDINQASSIAHTYAALVAPLADRRLALHGLRRAGNALLRIGRPTEAREYLSESLKMCTRYELPFQEFASLDLIVSSYLSVGDAETCDRHIARMRALVRKTATPQLEATLFVVEALLSWLRCDPPPPIAVAVASALQNGSLLRAPKHALLTASIACEMRRGSAAISSADLDACVALFTQGRALGGQDLRASVLISALTMAGRDQEAAVLRAQYLTRYRRESSHALLPDLQLNTSKAARSLAAG